MSLSKSKLNFTSLRFFMKGNVSRRSLCMKFVTWILVRCGNVLQMARPTEIASNVLRIPKSLGSSNGLCKDNITCKM